MVFTKLIARSKTHASIATFTCIALCIACHYALIESKLFLVRSNKFQTISAANASITQVSTPTKSNTTTSSAANTSKTVSARKTAYTMPVTVPLPSCVPLTLGQPSQLDLTNASSGLTMNQAPISYYRIYGDTASQLRSQIQHCAPAGENISAGSFTAITSYSLSWSYSYTQLNGVCTISAVKIGLHTAIALPVWSPTVEATSGLSSRWQLFLNSLIIHENGHVSIFSTYATKLTNDLQTMPPVTCSDLTSSVTTLINRDVTAMNYADNAYEVQTNYGATQGAILPTY